MALVLAIEPNSAQAAVLRRLLGTRADTDVVVVGSTDAAVAAIDKRVPDLVLVGALLSPRDEDPFIAHLRALPDAGHLQTLTIPQLRQTSGGARRSMSIFRKRKRRRTDDAAGGCDPTQFGDEVAASLSRACEVKAEIEQRQTAAGEEDPPVAESPEPVGSHSSGSVEGPSPQDARRFTDPGSGLEGVQDQSEGMQHQGVAAPEAGTVPRAETQTLAAELGRVRADAERTLGAELAAAEGRHAAEMSSLETAAAESLAAAAREAQTAAEAQAAQTLAAELDQVRADAERTLATELTTAEHRHGTELARFETMTAEKGDAAARDGQAADQTLAAELERVRDDAERTLTAELAAAEHRHAAELSNLETAARESSATAAREAQVAAEAQAAETLAAELERVRDDTERTLAAELARLETMMAEKETAARHAQTAAEAQAAQTLAAELVDQVRADAERTLAAELTRLETEAAEKGAAAARDGQAAAQALAAEWDRVRADAERTLAAELAAAEHRHGAAMTSFQTEATESLAAAAREAQAAAEAQAAQTLAAELERVRADGERTLAAGLAAAERRHSAELARLETEAAENRHGVAMLSVETEAAEIRAAVAGEAQAAAAAQATQTLTAELERVRADGERTLAAELAAAEHRHGAAMTSLETAAAEHRHGAAMTSLETAAAEHRHGAEIASLETAAADSRAAATRDVQTAAVAQRVRAEATRQAVAREADAGRDPLRATAPSISISLRPSLEPVHRAERDAGGVADYYSLWQARIAAANAPRVEVGVALPPGVDPRRRRWALSVAATLLILLLNNPESGSAPRHAVAAVEAASVSHAIEPAPIPGGVGLRDPREPVAEDTPGTGVSGRTQFRQLPMEVMCVLAVMLLLRIALFVGEGFVWHGLVASLGLVLLGFALMRAPWGG